MHVSTFLTGVNEPRKFSSEFEVPCPSAKLFHLEQFAIYGITFQDNRTVTFNDNYAINGGVSFMTATPIIRFQGNSEVTFGDNNALSDGGVMYIDHRSIPTFTFQGNCTVTFNGNTAINGAVMIMAEISFSTITFQGNSEVTFRDNSAVSNGGVMYIDGQCTDHSSRELYCNI